MIEPKLDIAITGSLVQRLAHCEKIMAEARQALNEYAEHTHILEQENESLRQAIARKP
jgi:hypothetical protein